MILDPLKVPLLSVASAPFSTTFPCSHCQWRFLDAAESSSFFSCDLWGPTRLFRVFRTTLGSTVFSMMVEPDWNHLKEPLMIQSEFKPHEGPTLFHRIVKFWLHFSQLSKIIISHITSSFQKKQPFSHVFISFMPTERFLYKQKASFCRRFIYKDLFTFFYLQKKDQKEQRTYLIFTWTFIPTDQGFIKKNSSRTKIKIPFSFSLNQHHHFITQNVLKDLTG